MILSKFFSRLLLLLAISLLAGGLWLAPTLAQGPSPDRPSPPPGSPGGPPGRPQPPGGGGGTGGGGQPGGDHGGGGPIRPCATVHGFADNWGYGHQPKLPVDLAGYSWQTAKLTDDNGYYASDCLGLGVALLNLKLPPGMAPSTTDVAIRLGYLDGFEVNLGLYSGSVPPPPPVALTMTAAPARLLPGQAVTYTISLTNTSGRPMSGVMVTDLLPEALLPAAPAATAGSLELWGNLVTADLGSLAPGAAVTLHLPARLRADAPPVTTLTNRASLLYHDHVASQTAPVVVAVGGEK